MSDDRKENRPDQREPGWFDELRDRLAQWIDLLNPKPVPVPVPVRRR